MTNKISSRGSVHFPYYIIIGDAGGGQCPFTGILISRAARGTCAVERFAGAHPSQRSWAPSYRAADGHAF